jgi:hypothetical protein
MIERKIRLTRSKAMTYPDAGWQRTGAAPARLGRQNGFCPPGERRDRPATPSGVANRQPCTPGPTRRRWLA